MKTIQMEQSTVCEALHLFEVMDNYDVTCSLEMKLDDLCDPIVGICAQPVKAEYIENASNGDALIVHLGESEFCFELNLSIYKHITESQVSLCISNDKYSAWFDSGLIPTEGIEEARNYKDVDLDALETEPFEVNKYERQLIDFVRSVVFEDILDATTGIYAEAEKAKVKSVKCRSIRPDQSAGFIERGGTLEKLAELLGVANTDYRSHIYPEGQLND